MRVWVETFDGRVREFDVDDLPDAQAKALELKAKDWDISSFRNPPRPPEPKEEIKYLPA